MVKFYISSCGPICWPDNDTPFINFRLYQYGRSDLCGFYDHQLARNGFLMFEDDLVAKFGLKYSGRFLLTLIRIDCDLNIVLVFDGFYLWYQSNCIYGLSSLIDEHCVVDMMSNGLNKVFNNL